jgi:hypothetical protein
MRWTAQLNHGFGLQEVAGAESQPAKAKIGKHFFQPGGVFQRPLHEKIDVAGKTRVPMEANRIPPTIRYLTPVEFNNAINSRKSLFSFMALALVNQAQQDVQTLLGRKRTVKGAVSPLAFPMRSVLSNDLIHVAILYQTMRMTSFTWLTKKPESGRRSETISLPLRPLANPRD